MSGRKQFDVDAAVDSSMRAFWRDGYADTSIDAIGAATGLGRGSLYSAFGGKNDLFLRALDRYGELYGALYDAALRRHAGDPVRAVAAFLDVVLDRIADPDVPDGCLVASAAAQSSTLEPDARARVRAALDQQTARVRAALVSSGITGRTARELAIFVVAVSQSLGVLSRAGTELRDLRVVARTAVDAVRYRVTEAPR